MKWNARSIFVFFTTVGAILTAELVCLLLYLHPASMEDRRAFVDILSKTWGGTAILAGVYLTAVNLLVTEGNIAAIERGVEVNRQALENNRKAADETAHIAREGQITERFTRAIEQLGNEKMEIHLGGIYALERIALDSPRDSWTIMEVLAAYVRRERHWMRPPGATDTELDGFNADPLPEDIQGILDILGRRDSAHDAGTRMLNLAHTDLRGAILTNARLDGVNLKGTNLARVPMQNISMEYANLIDAILIGAWITPDEQQTAGRTGRSLLNYATLEGARCDDAKMMRCGFVGANLGGANLAGADLSEADLTDAHIHQIQLETTLSYVGALLPHGLTPDSRMIARKVVPQWPDASYAGAHVS